MKKTLVARLSVQSEFTDQFLDKAKKMIQLSNLEEGCLTYRLYQEIDSLTDFIFFEEYKNQEAIDNHNSSSYFKEFISFILPKLNSDPIIEVF